MDKLLLGAAREIITPEIGGKLAGYMSDFHSTHVNDDLTVSVVALRYGNVQAMLISAALCLIDSALADEIKEAISAENSISKENIIFSCIHTHTGPSTYTEVGWGSVDRAYCDGILIPKTLRAARAAMADMHCAYVGVGEGHSDVGINRRQCGTDNVIKLGQCTWGKYDPTMTVISFRGEDKKPLLNLVHYGAHCTAAGLNAAISRDWAGYMIDRIEKDTGAMTVFFNGAEGDVGPRLTNGDTMGNDGMSYAADLGGIAASDAIGIYRKIKSFRSVSMETVSDTLHLPYAERITEEEALKQLEEFKPTMSDTCNEKEVGYLHRVVEAWQKLLPQKKELVLPQTVIRLGDVVFIPFQFEPFSEISLRLRDYSAFSHTLCLGCSNGNISYLPSEDQICRGGYEVFMFLTNGTQHLVNDVDKHIINENLRLTELFTDTEE